MASTSEDNIRRSVEETNRFINPTINGSNEQRNEVRGDELRIPSYTPVISQRNGSEPDDQSLPNTWNSIREEGKNIGWTIWKFIGCFCKCLNEVINLCELLILLVLHSFRFGRLPCKLIGIFLRFAIVKIVDYFSKKRFCQENKTTRGTQCTETMIQMEADNDGFQGSI
ncbi:uncharacterized protein RB166_011765 isoform 1-T1 [Leptodactylus fuscus]